jgi:hypothetical protein
VFFFFFFFFCKQTYIQTTKEPKALQIAKEREGGGSFPLHMGVEGGGKISGNAARETSCRGPKRHMMGTEVCTSMYFFCFPTKGRGNERQCTGNNGLNMPVNCDGRGLKGSNHN